MGWGVAQFFKLPSHHRTVLGGQNYTDLAFIEPSGTTLRPDSFLHEKKVFK